MRTWMALMLGAVGGYFVLYGAVAFGGRLAREEIPHTAFGVGGGSGALSSQALLAQAAPEASGSV
ncbi:MAG: hypothetical protein K2P33_07380, partial [Acutalibacter sp.]|nr:hypothetical protein [Acutalibacter sp.]